jgi:hypothetical protein
MGRYTTGAEVLANFLPAVDLSALPSSFNVLDQLNNVYIPMAEDELDRQFGQTLSEETLHDVAMDGSGDYGICLPHFPIKTVLAVRVVFGFERTIYNFKVIRHLASKLLGLPQDWHNGDGGPLPDMFVDRDSGTLNIDLTGSLLSLAAMPGTYPVWQVNFPGGPRDVKADYIHGFPAASIPVDVKNAAGMLAASFVGAMGVNRQTGGAVRVHIGSVDKTYASGLANAPINSLWQEKIQDTISRWSQKPLGN